MLGFLLRITRARPLTILLLGPLKPTIYNIFWTSVINFFSKLKLILLILLSIGRLSSRKEI